LVDAEITSRSLLPCESRAARFQLNLTELGGWVVAFDWTARYNFQYKRGAPAGGGRPRR